VFSTLNPDVAQRTDVLREQFANARPFRHVVIDHFLDTNFCNDLIAGFPRFDEKLAMNEHGEVGPKAVFPKLPDAGPAYARFDRLMRDREFLDWVGRITGIRHLLYDPEYVGGGTHENLNGAELDTHVDFNYHPRTHLHRRLNLIVFLNEEWESEWGGCLELLRDPWSTSPADRIVTTPIANRAVIFETTERSWHGFRKIRMPPERNVSRRSIAVYFYTADRPKEETAGSHATIYYQRPLPDHIREGYTLQEVDVQELQALLTRRDHQMKFLYEREQEFNEALSSIVRSPSLKAGRALTWPARALRDLLRRK